ncbi:MAG: flavin reductase [Frankiaceae bacterium]|nr:flavin reductase [Frankiaceae bacterium]MBV9872193.1 flavin reductase [Frankiaceae bacterium]
MTSDELDAVVDLLNYPMFVVTTRHGDERSGCLVGFASQVSINPRRFLVGLSNKNHTYRVAREAERLAVHVLDRDDRSLAELFGTQTGDEVDKFAACDWTDGPEGVPVLSAAPAWFSGRILGHDRLGDHEGFLIEPDSAYVADGDLSLLTFAEVSDLEPGHEA